MAIVHTHRLFSYQLVASLIIKRCLKPNYASTNVLSLINCPLNKYVHSPSVLMSEKSIQKPNFKVKKEVPELGVVKVRRKVFIQKITLFTAENGMEIVTLDEAKKIADRRHLKLLKVSDKDPKSDRPIYKLAPVHADSLKEKKKASDSKDEKVLGINSNISEHDLQSKIKNVLKWLSKGHTVKATIAGDVQNPALTEKVFTVISEAVEKEGRITQKNSKNGEIKFHIVLPKKVKGSITIASTGDLGKSDPKE